jgi:hypothetical protein
MLGYRKDHISKGIYLIGVQIESQHQLASRDEANTKNQEYLHSSCNDLAMVRSNSFLRRES